MKIWTNKLLSMLLCVCLCLGMVSPAFAAGESNTLGVSFRASLDRQELTVSDQAQTVVLHIAASSPVTVDGIGFTTVMPGDFTVQSVTSEDLTYATSDFANGIFGWTSSDSENVTGVTSIAVVTFTVPANTPAGTYTVGIEKLELTRDYGEIWEKGASASATLEIVDQTSAAGYTASVNTLSSEVTVEETVAVNVGVSHDSDASFAAAELFVHYDASRLAFNQGASTLGAATVKDENGVLILEDYGADKNFGTGVYVLVFDAIAPGTAEVKLTSAAFVDKENAVKYDLIPAAITSDTVSFTINKKVFAVTLDPIFTGEATVTDGERYTFAQADDDNYDYGTVNATMNGVSVDVTDNGDGTYTVENVTGPLTITGTRTEKVYTVTVSGNAAEDITDAAATATYNTDYTFTVPTVEGWAYSLEGITIDGEAYTGYSVEDGKHTIPGGDITGPIVITVSKSQTIASVAVEGTGAGAAAGFAASAKIGDAYTLTIVPASGYTYTVTATMGGEAVELAANGDNTYTVEKVTGNLVFTVNRTVIADGVTVAEYLSLNGTTMWLIRNDIQLEEGSIPTFNGENMFWSERYKAYCALTVAQTLTAEEAAAMVGIGNGTAVSVDYGMDVNQTGIVDASDAQLVYNMYNVLYNGFTADATVDKFLRADINADGIINVEDAAAIIAAILA